jgi:mannitol-1-phosphate 5-dehydrogenase
MDSSSTLGRHVRALLNPGEIAYHAAHFGYPDCMISRVVPRPEPDPLFIVTEDYNEWTARADAFLGPKPDGLDALELVPDQDARLERKLFVHNGGHAICGYFGFRRGHRYIHEAVGDGFVAEHVLGALDEIGEVVRRKHGFSAESIDAYKQDLVRRGSIPEMCDEIVRVVRDPIRKLSPRERLLGPALLAVEYGLPRRWLVRGIAAALHCDNPADPIALDLQARIRNRGLIAVLQDVCGLAPESVLTREIAEAWDGVSLT